MQAASYVKIFLIEVWLRKDYKEEDEWGGAYYHDVMSYNSDGSQSYDDLTIFLSLVRLYGTDDYYLVQQRMHYGEEMDDFMVFEFLTESDGALIH